MDPESVVPREPRLEGSAPSATFQRVHAFPRSGPSGGLAFTGSRSRSLGASVLSFERASKTFAIVIAFAATATFTTDPVIASSLAPTELEVPGDQLAAIEASEPTAEVRSLAGIVTALDEDPIEDGVTHRAERALDAHLDQFGSMRIVRAVSASASSARAAALLRLLGRSARVDTEQRKALVRWGLSSESVDVRDAAVQAVENWEDRSLLELLRGHREPVAWLADYAANVVFDLGV